ncbi:hypothetical protein ACFXG4_23590 [Nocardia sp. NPDC059246]|uniref:hypothetical protein n=1 Tax=unclassified Nocardia TaxID=2637762 RepID=UPI00367448E7
MFTTVDRFVRNDHRFSISLNESKPAYSQYRYRVMMNSVIMMDFPTLEAAYAAVDRYAED